LTKSLPPAFFIFQQDLKINPEFLAI